ncbi:MAG: PIN domain-containing protein [Nitrososphaerota archaeon]|jgi:predicted nucleic acid-binding protein|nr:PIN domain-containing protein [Nitrososphaerota archaeon]MDG6955920.1 PIN domain-containing protein [Nitrososphaerota archaeon]MDG6959057.1 PIN domain-containing protein [Nitrososphaerota archaeon]MDG6968904.1 PIN domain-containing protein [Nitrososphaerota archaeon]MDG6973240.1 PIN domain-containing protein [Nitrososphaerota archaeon]
MTSFVFDAGALPLIYAKDERLHAVVEEIASGEAEGLVPSVILAEFYYRTCRSSGKDVALLRSRQLSERLTVMETSIGQSRAAGMEKCRNNRLSLAGSFVLALARGQGGTILTTDGELAKEPDVDVRYLQV